MDQIVSIIIFGAFVLAIITRLLDEDKKAKKRERISNRTNTSAWKRSNKR